MSVVRKMVALLLLVTFALGVAPARGHAVAQPQTPAAQVQGGSFWTALACAGCVAGGIAIASGGAGAILVAAATEGSTLVAAACVGACYETFAN